MPITSAAHGPLPIIVGVTGHRDLRAEDLRPLEAAVRRTLETLEAGYPHTDIVILSPLAEGADRLVVRVGLELGLRFAAPLPLGREHYGQDFSDPASAAEFDQLVEKADVSFVVPSVDEPTRPECYARVGAYVARHCHLLLALWDGHPSDKAGGVAQTIRCRREGVAPEYAAQGPFDPPDVGIVCHIVTPRMSRPAPNGRPFDVCWLPPVRCASESDAKAAFHRICRSTDAFNKIGARVDARTTAEREKCAAFLLSRYGPASVPPGLQAIRSLYACAEQAALRFQSRTRWTVRSLFWLAFGMIVSFEFFSEGDALLPAVSTPVKLAVYLILLAGGSWLLKWSKWREIDTKHLDYRALVEGLRVHFSWRVAEVRGAAADYCLRYGLDDLDWIRMALRSCELLAPAFTWTDTAEASSAALRAVVDDWVKGQHQYFSRAARRESARARTLQRGVTLFFGLTGIAGAAVCVLTFNVVPAAPESLHAAAIVAFGMSTAAAALTHGYAEQRAVSMHVTRYEHMQELFGAGVRALDAAVASGDWLSARELLRELGRKAIEENIDWVSLHRERPIALPQ